MMSKCISNHRKTNTKNMASGLAITKNACRRLTCENASKQVHFYSSRCCFAHVMDARIVENCSKFTTKWSQKIRRPISQWSKPHAPTLVSSPPAPEVTPLPLPRKDQQPTCTGLMGRHLQAKKMPEHSDTIFDTYVACSFETHTHKHTHTHIHTNTQTHKHTNTQTHSYTHTQSTEHTPYTLARPQMRPLPEHAHACTCAHTHTNARTGTRILYTCTRTHA